MTEEVAKLQKHLALLRQEYVKMQRKLADTERRCAMLAAQASVQGSTKAVARSEDTFISRLLEIVAELYQQDQYR